MSLGRWIRYGRHYRNWRELTRERDAGRRPGVAILRNGLRFEAPKSVNVLRPVAACIIKRCYTPPGFEIGPQDVVVDVGANIGAFSVWAASQTSGRVLAIEPFPENAEYVRRNVLANGSDVEVLEMALADRDGTTHLFLSDKGTTHQLFEQTSQGQLEQSIEVPCLSLESLLHQHELERIDLLKLDCEGAEGLILGAAPDAVLKRIRRIAAEFHDYASPLDHDALAARLKTVGFETRLDWNGRSPTGYLYAART